MKPKQLLTASAAVLCAFTAISSRADAAPPQYIVLDLGTLGGTSSRSFGINAFGQVTGYSDIAGGGSRGFVWTGAALTELPTLGGPGSGGHSINDSGQVAGTSTYNNVNYGHAARWTGTTPTDLGTLGQFQNIGSQGRGINASGQVAGFSNINGGGINHAVRSILQDRWRASLTSAVESITR
jgi:probable HAF family extracellular repeat protein